MGLFGQAKDMYKLQKKAKQIKEELKNLHIEAETEGVKIVVNAEQEVQEVSIPEEMCTPVNLVKLQNALKTVFNKAIKKSQEIASERMRDMMNDLGMAMPGEGELPPAE